MKSLQKTFEISKKVEAALSEVMTKLRAEGIKVDFVQVEVFEKSLVGQIRVKL